MSWLFAVALVVFGIFKLVRPRSHPRWVGLRVGPRELGLWSLLMSSWRGREQTTSGFRG
jgi:hypothetical protein